ncbi:CDP-alcohol phosphatidyltransferase class-I family [Apiospora arundinis]
MSTKRPRATFEADLQNQQSPYVHFGTPLPPLDRETRDDGSYVPVWKQEVRDERGRKRLHGAFTGGFSAGYFNTVGSKEGWTPSAFVSSRTNRHGNKDKDVAADGAATAKPQTQQRPEDFMDEEDLADQAEAQKLQTASGFAGLGSTEQDSAMRRGGGLADLFRSSGETMGIKLLKRMGWKEGQGIGPKVRRKARLDTGANKNGAARVVDEGVTETYLFAPENVRMIAFVKKLDRKGLGYAGEAKLAPMATAGTKKGLGVGSSDEEDEDGPLIRPRIGKKKAKPSKGGIGIGILNDTGSDDEDPYEIGPRISYNRVIGGDKKKKKKATTAVNPSLRSAPVLITRKDALSKAGKNLRKCHDGRLPLAGFSFGTDTDTLTSMINSDVKYPPPKIPSDWKSSKEPKGSAGTNNSASYLSTADAAKASKLDPQARAALLGEAQLPGKSVFDFLSADARQRLAAASGKTNLPPALGEIPAGYAMTPEEKQRELASQVPALEKDTAIAALTRSAAGATGSGNTPYADDDAKRGRYRAYLEHAAGYSKAAALPAKAPGQRPEDYLREMREFHSVARIFRPMSGMMASRFTTSSTSSSSTLFTGSSAAETGAKDLLSKPAKVKAPADPAEEAASLGMFGAMTRSVTDFYPTRLLCKRFNVRPPAHVQPDGGNGDAKAGTQQPQQSPFETAMYGAAGGSRMSSSSMDASPSYPDLTAATAAAGDASAAGTGMGMGTAMTLDELLKQAQQQPSESSRDMEMSAKVEPERTEVDASVNESLEGKRAQDEVLKAIFGDDSDEDEE